MLLFRQMYKENCHETTPVTLSERTSHGFLFRSRTGLNRLPACSFAAALIGCPIALLEGHKILGGGVAFRCDRHVRMIDCFTDPLDRR